jgi:hypothetical protein
MRLALYGLFWKNMTSPFRDTGPPLTMDPQISRPQLLTLRKRIGSFKPTENT